MKRKGTYKVSSIIFIILLLITPLLSLISVYADSYRVEDQEDITDMDTLINMWSSDVCYAKGYYWVVLPEAGSRDIWLYNSSDGVSWFGVELELTHEHDNDKNEYWFDLHMTADSLGDLHIAYTTDLNQLLYIKVETFADGTINDLGTVQVVATGYCRDVAVTGGDYPVVLYWGSTLKITKSTTKDGTWASDYDVEVSGLPASTIGTGSLIPMLGHSGTDFIVVWKTVSPLINWAGSTGLSSYFNGLTESFVNLNGTLKYTWINWGINMCFHPHGYLWNPPVGLDVTVRDNETFVTVIQSDTPLVQNPPNKELWVYRTINGGQSWEGRLICTLSTSTTDWGGIISRFVDKSLYVFYRHDDINGGNHTFFYSRIDEDNIESNFVSGSWDEWGIEIFDDAFAWDDDKYDVEGFSSWTLTQSLGINYNQLKIIYGHDHTIGSIDDEVWFIVDGVLGIEPSLPQPELLNISLQYDDYLYMGEVYLLDSYWNNTDYCYFQTTDTIHIWRYYYNNETKQMGIRVTDFSGTITNEMVIGGIYVQEISNYTGKNSNLTRLRWRFIFNKQIVDCLSQSITYYGENRWFTVGDTGNYTSGLTGVTINIYNLGGYTLYRKQNTGYHLIGGDSFELGVITENDSIQANVTFRKLQHVHMLVEWFFNNSIDGDHLLIEDDTILGYGFDYKYDGAWVRGWYVTLRVVDGKVGQNGIFNDGSWIRIQVRWYNGLGNIIKTDYIYAYHYGYDVPSTSYSDRRSTQLWIDLWFNKMNASTVVGGRVNAYYHGMREQGWWLWSNWSPMIGNVTASMFFDNLLDKDGNIIASQELELVRCYALLWRAFGDTNGTTEYVYNYEILNWKYAEDRMEGVDTPVFVETKSIEMPQGGFLAPLVKAFQGIAMAIWKAGLGFSKIFIGAMDSLLAFVSFGLLPNNSFSMFIRFISMSIGTMISYMQYAIQYALSMLNVFGEMLSFFLTIIGYFINAIIWVFTYVVGFPLIILRFFIALMTGGVFTLGVLTFDFTNYGDLMGAGLIMVPYAVAIMFIGWLVFGDVYFNRENIEGFPKRLLEMFGYMKEAYQSGFWVLNHIRNEVISVYNFIRSHIWGGGGGETEE